MSKKLSAIAVVALLMLATAQMAMAVEPIPASAEVACPTGQLVSPITYGGDVPLNAELAFGPVNPGVTSPAQSVILTTSVGGAIEGGVCTIPNTQSSVTVVASPWTGTEGSPLSDMPSTSTSGIFANNPIVFGTPITMPIGENTLSFTVTPPVDAIVDSYTQTITITIEGI